MSFCLFAGMVLNGQALKVDADGDIGIGTGTPEAKFHLLDGTSNVHIQNSTAASLSGTTIDITGGLTGSMRIGAIDIASNSFGGAAFQAFSNSAPAFKGQFYFDAGSAPGAGLFFRVGGGQPRMAVIDNGNVGIGTGSPTEKLEVAGNIKASGTVTSSDKRLKSDVNKFQYGLAEVVRLNPVSFIYNGQGGTNNGEYHVGLVAQELQKITPELVEEFTHKTLSVATLEKEAEVLKEETFLQIRDSEIKYLLVNAIKEQQTLIDSQLDMINELSDEVEALRNTITLIEQEGNTEITDEIGVDFKLGQNFPNPFNSNTKIEYTIPAGTKTAQINFFNSTGQLLKTTSIKSQGQGVLDLKNSNLPSGVYSYSLMIDGKSVATKQMSVAN